MIHAILVGKGTRQKINKSLNKVINQIKVNIGTLGRL